MRPTLASRPERSTLARFFFSCKNPINASSRIRLQLEKKFHRWQIVTKFVFRELRLTDAKNFAKICLIKIKTANFPDAASNRFFIWRNFNILLDCNTYGSLLFSLRIQTE